MPVSGVDAALPRDAFGLEAAPAGVRQADGSLSVDARLGDFRYAVYTRALLRVGSTRSVPKRKEYDVSEGVFVHDRGLVEPGARIGAGTRIWAFAHVLGGAVIGRDCNICDQTFIENDVRIGDRVTIKCGVQIWDGVRLEDDVFVGPNATFTNDLFPRSKEYPEKFTETFVRRGASIGANATILAGRTIGEYAMVGAGAVVTKDVPPYAIVAGNPATVRGFVDRSTGRKQGE
jgi:acetyltransferase-like isoleucine patch superfamily enzyme